MSFEEERFCVYAHLRKDNGEYFYIGQGTHKRAKQGSRKLKAWKDTVSEAGGFTPKILCDGLTKDEALEIESFLIEWLEDSIVNNPKSKSTVKELDFDEMNARYYVDDSSPTGLRYKEDIYAHNKAHKRYSILSRAGDVAGNTSKTGWQISYNRKSYIVHRIVYLLTHGSINKHMVIDHIDGDVFNNSISNLRQITQAENQRNKALDKRNTSGIPCVNIRNNGAVIAAITILGKRYFKRFSIKKHGKYEAVRLAIEWRKLKLKEAEDQNYKYSERHTGL